LKMVLICWSFRQRLLGTFGTLLNLLNLSRRKE
jgi:hypothetical protein